MNTRFRRPIQAAALLFSLSLLIGYLWSTQRQSSLPGTAAHPATWASPDQIENHADGSYTITLDPETITEFEGFINFGKPIQPGSQAAPLMPGSKNISQPVFSTRKASSEPAPPPVMPGSKVGIFSLPIPAPNMSSSKSENNGPLPPHVIDSPEKTSP